jgi:hypothetical protein
MKWTYAAFFISMSLLAAAGPAPKSTDKSGENLPIVSIEGARCSIERDGKAIADLIEPGMGDKVAVLFVHIDMASHDDIIVTCSKDGYKQQSKRASVVASRWIEVGAPCEPPENSTREEIQVYCTQHSAAKAENSLVMAYPKVVISLKRRSAE